MRNVTVVNKFVLKFLKVARTVDLESSPHEKKNCKNTR